MTIEIPLSKTGKHAGKYVAIVDDIDADLADISWRVKLVHNHLQYAQSTPPKTRITKMLHRVIAERMLGRTLGTTEFIDHINGNGLNNTRKNLRVATNSQNIANSYSVSTNKTGYKGVTKRGNKWQAMARVDGKKKYLGMFDTDIEAHRAYCITIVNLFGGYVNFGANSPFTPDMFTEGRVA